MCTNESSENCAHVFGGQSTWNLYFWAFLYIFKQHQVVAKKITECIRSCGTLPRRGGPVSFEKRWRRGGGGGGCLVVCCCLRPLYSHPSATPRAHRPRLTSRRRESFNMCALHSHMGTWEGVTDTPNLFSAAHLFVCTVGKVSHNPSFSLHLSFAWLFLCASFRLCLVYSRACVYPDRGLPVRDERAEKNGQYGVRLRGGGGERHC